MSPEDAGFLVAAGTALGVPPSPAAVGRLGRFLELLEVWNDRIRLTGEREPATLLRKHVVDCIAPGILLPPSGLVVDIGSGGGFPGLVLGCLRPDLELLMVEPRRRPRSFLAEAVREIPLPKGRAVERRGEQLADDPAVRGMAAVVIARALRIDAFLPLAAPLLAPDGVAIAMQTPAITPEEAARIGSVSRLALRSTHDYQLPGGEGRRLIVYRRP